MTCNTCPYVHRTSAITATGVLTVSNSTNVGNFDPFCLIVTIDPSAVIVGAPVATTITINGTAVPLVDIWGYPITTDILQTRCKFRGKYIENATPHITVVNVLGNQGV